MLGAELERGHGARPSGGSPRVRNLMPHKVSLKVEQKLVGPGRGTDEEVMAAIGAFLSRMEEYRRRLGAVSYESYKRLLRN